MNISCHDDAVTPQGPHILIYTCYDHYQHDQLYAGLVLLYWWKRNVGRYCAWAVSQPPSCLHLASHTFFPVRHWAARDLLAMCVRCNGTDWNSRHINKDLLLSCVTPHFTTAAYFWQGYSANCRSLRRKFIFTSLYLLVRQVSAACSKKWTLAILS